MTTAPGRHGRDAPDGDAGQDAGSSPVELAAVMTGVIALLLIVVLFGMRWLAAEAATAAAQRALEVAQSDGGSPDDARAVAERLAYSSHAVSRVDVGVYIGTVDATVTVEVTSVLGGEPVVRSASGPLLRFVPQKPDA